MGVTGSWVSIILAACAVAGCATGEATSTPGASAPPAALPTSPAAPSAPPRAAPGPSPIQGRFVGGSSGESLTRLTPDPCDYVVVAVAAGTAKVAGEALAEGDEVILRYASAPLDVLTSGTALVATVHHPCAIDDMPAISKHVLRAGTAADLAWAGGAMHAHLDAEKDVSPDFYLGRLEGTGPVAEHSHAGAWEVLFAYQAAGTFTLDGHPQRLGGYGVVSVPPDTKHSWTPDPGSKLVAFQMYDPPGPEQRFKALARDAAK